MQLIAQMISKWNVTAAVLNLCRFCGLAQAAVKKYVAWSSLAALKKKLPNTHLVQVSYNVSRIKTERILLRRKSSMVSEFLESDASRDSWML
jgi:hypothetical protein